MEERGGEQEQGGSSGTEDERVDPGVGGGSEAANQKQEEQGAHQEEDLGGPKPWLLGPDEESHQEEAEPQTAGQDVGNVADAAGPQIHRDLPQSPVASDEVGDPVADLGAAQDLGGVGDRAKDRSIDADDGLAGPDAGPVCPRVLDHLGDHEASRGVGREDDTVPGAGKEHVHDREARQAEGEQPQDEDGGGGAGPAAGKHGRVDPGKRTTGRVGSPEVCHTRHD